jgi:hypothetical protein
MNDACGSKALPVVGFGSHPAICVYVTAPVAGLHVPGVHTFGGEITGAAIVWHVPAAVHTYVGKHRFVVFPHAAPGFGAYVTAPVVGLQVPTMHGFDVLMTGGAPSRQSPCPSQVYAPVQRSALSPHEVPAAAGAPCTHAPVASQVSAPPQAFGVTPQVVPTGTGEYAHPVAGMQTPTWHPSGAAHVTAVPLPHVPAWHVSPSVHWFPSLHAVPFVTGVFAHEPSALHESAVHGLLSLHWLGVHVVPPLPEPPPLLLPELLPLDEPPLPLEPPLLELPLPEPPDAPPEPLPELPPPDPPEPLPDAMAPSEASDASLASASSPASDGPSSPASSTGAQLPLPSQAPVGHEAPASSAAPLEQTPLAHEGPCAHAVPATHEVPSGADGFEHAPDVGSHVPATWQESEAAHVTGLVPVHVPVKHWSVCVQALPSLQVVPSDALGLEHWPLVGSQLPTTWH